MKKIILIILLLFLTIGCSGGSVSLPEPASTQIPDDPLLSEDNDETGLFELRNYALKIINEIRVDEGLSELTLSENPTAQILADHSFETRFYGTLLSNGKTDKMIYLDNGGDSYIRTHSWILGYFNKKNDGTYDWAKDTDCRVNPLIDCRIINPKNKVKEFIYHPDYRDNILNPAHKKFNIGIAYDSFLLFSYISFEGGDFVVDRYEINGSVIDIEIRNNSNDYEMNDNSFQIYYFPLPDQELDEQAYVVKKNFIDSIQNEEIAYILKPPDGRRYYSDLESNQIVADTWIIEGDTLKIKANLGEYFKKPGFYSIGLWGKNNITNENHMLINLGRNKFDNKVTEKSDKLKNDFTLNELRQYVLELINNDRADHGVDPVELGNDETAQIHAEESFKNDYHSHWFLSGEKPYMIYSKNGGKSYVAENAASETGGNNKSFNCNKNPKFYCNKIDIKEELRQAEWDMMYDDAHADWGHRDNIINSKHNKVNLGIVFDDYVYSFIQHFEADHFEIEDVILDGSKLSFNVKNNSSEYKISDSNIVIYYDPIPEPLTTDWLNDDNQKKAMGYSYCIGGGTNCFQDENGERILSKKDYIAAYILYPPGENRYYSDLDPEDIVANKWDLKNNGSLHVEANMKDRINKEGIYTIIIWGDHKTSGETHSLINYSFRK